MEQNIIYNMDCIAGMSYIPNGAVDLILTDLPYGITACVWDSVLPMDELWNQWNRVLKPTGAVVLTACQPFTTKVIQSNIHHFKYAWYWHKNYATGHCFAKYQPMRCIEDVLVFSRKTPTYNPQGLQEIPPRIEHARAPKADSVYKQLDKPHVVRFQGYPKNLLEVKGERGLHPTQKPVALFEYLIRTYTNPGELALDCCMGSGTTAIACIRSDRQYIGFELDEQYYQTATERILKERGKQDGNEA